MYDAYFLAAGAGALTLAAALTDLKARRIPNWLTVPAALAGLAFHGLAPSGWGFGTSVGGFAVGFGLLLIPFLLGGGGMGDVKLLAALGAWLGPALLFVAFALSIGLAAGLAMSVLIYQTARLGLCRTRKRFLNNARGAATNCPAPRRVLPFAVPVALSTWVVLAWIVGRTAA